MITIESRRFFVYKLPLIRGICILGVILIHTTGYFAVMTQFGWLFYTLVFLNNFARFAVPLFIVFSGFYLSLNPRNVNAVPFYHRTLRFLLVPYILYSLLYSIWNLRSGGNLWSIIKDIPSASAAAHLWFGLLILQLYLMYPLLRRWYLACKRRGALVLSALLLQIVWQVLSITLFPLVWSNLSTSLFPDSSKLTVTLNWYANKFTILIFIGNIGYFLSGFYLLEHSEEISRLFKRPLITFTGAIVWVTTAAGLAAYWIVPLLRGTQWNAIEHRSLLNIFILPILSFGALVTILSLAKKQIVLKSHFSRWFISFGLYSYGIYYLHPFFISLFSWGFTHFINPHPYYIVSFYVLQFTVVAIVTLLVVKILARSPFGKYLT